MRSAAHSDKRSPNSSSSHKGLVLASLAILLVVAFLTITRKDVTEIRAAHLEAQVLIVAPPSVPASALLEAVRARVAHGPARFFLLIPNPSEHAELTDAQRARHHADGEQILSTALPMLNAASGAASEGTVSHRHDPMDAIEETLRDGDFHEIILSVLPHGISQWLHTDLPHRISHLGLPVTTVVADATAPV